MEQSPSWETTTSSASQEKNRGLRRFITAFTNAHHPSPPCAKISKSTPSHLTTWRYILILSPIYTKVFQVASFPQASPSKRCIHTSRLQYVPHARTISFFLNWLPKYLVRSENHEAACKAVRFFYRLLKSEMFFVNGKLTTHYSRLMLLIKI